MIPTVDYIRILPELVLSVFGILVMMVDPLIPEQDSKKPLGMIAVHRHCSPGWRLRLIRPASTATAFYDTVSVDAFSVFFHVVVLLVALVVILTSFDYLEVQRIHAGEYYGLILFGTVGMMLMSSAVELVLIFIALEISSISTYILAGMRRRAAESAESSLKYFLLGSFATAFFLYGVALVFGATGTTNVYGIAHYLQGQPSTLAYLAMGLMFVGLGFKVALGPLPRMDAGCVRRRACARGRVDVDRTEGRGVCRAAARAVLPRSSRMVLDGVGFGRAFHDAWATSARWCSRT